MKNISSLLGVLLLCVSFAASASEAEDKRLMILQDERNDVVMQLQEEIAGYQKQKDKAGADKRIAVLRRNLSDLDTEIQHTGRIKEVRFVDSSGSSKLVAQASEKSSKESRASDGGSSPKEPWDVFGQF